MKLTHTQQPLKISDTDCEICKGRGWFFVKDAENEDYEVLRECKCGAAKKEKKSRLESFAEIPESFRENRLSSFSIDVYSDEKSKSRANTAMRAAKYWLNNYEKMSERGMGLYFYSETKGSGKTKMATSIANELITGNKTVKFCTALQILNEIKASWNRTTEGFCENKLLDALSDVEVLIIDDFGIEQADKPWINERFYQIINSRYTSNRITIFTSNERLSELKYDERIKSRLTERVFQIPFPEESIREIIAKENLEELRNGIRLVK